MVHKICAALQSPNTYLEDLCISHNEIGCVARADASLHHHKRVTTVLLCVRLFREAGGVSLAAMLRSPACQLMTLDASWNSLRGKGVAALGEAFLHNESLRCVSVKESSRVPHRAEREWHGC